MFYSHAPAGYEKRKETIITGVSMEQSLRHTERNMGCRLRVLASCLIAGMVFVVFAATVNAATTTPTTMNFQGRLMTSTGAAVADGLYNVKFAIYNTPTAGSVQWMETRETTNRVQVINGLFSTQLGAVTPLPASVFAAAGRYFEVTMATPATATCDTASCASWEAAMTPRSTIATSAYAYNAETIDGIDGAALAQLSVTNSFTNTNLITVSNANAFVVNSGSSNLFRIDTTGTGQVVVGTTNATGTVLVLDTKNDNTTDPTGTAGAMYYNSTAGRFRCYQAGAWADCISGAGASGTFQNVYDNSGTPATVTTTAAKGVAIAAGAAPTASIFKVSNTGFATTANDVNAIDVDYVGGATAVEGAGIRIDSTPGTQSGGTWSGLRIVANATGPVSGVTGYGIKLEGPTAQGAGIEKGMYIGSGWDIGADIQSGGLQMAGMTDPSAPAANNLRIYAKNTAGRMMLRVMAPSGIDYNLQPSLFQQQITLVTPGITATTIAASGNGIPVLTGTGAAATTTQAQGAMNRITSGSTAGTGAGVQTTTAGYYRGTGGNNADGYFYFARLNFADTTLANYTSTTTGIRFFAGLSSQNITGTTSMVSSDAPSAGVYSGFQYSAVRDTDGQFQFITRGTAQSVIPTGVALAVSKTYDFYIYVAPGGSNIYWRIGNLTDGVITEGNVTENLPTATTAMRTGFSIAPLSITARYVHWQRLYTESDR